MRIATGEEPEDYGPTAESEGKNAAAVALGRMGGKARAAALGKRKRKEIARIAAQSRWTNTDEQLNRMAGVSRSAKTFTPKQGQYLAFIHLYTRLHRRPPAETDMQKFFRVSPPSVHQMVLTLERAGFIRRQPRVPRSIEVLVDPKHLPELL